MAQTPPSAATSRAPIVPSLRGVRATLRQSPPVGGIEAALLAGLAGSKHAQSPGVDVGTLVRDLVPLSSNPYARMLSRSAEVAVALGALRRVGNDVGLLGHLVGKATSHLEAVPQALAPLDLPAGDLAARFAAFRTGEQALYTTLVQQASRALKQRERSED